VDGTSRLGTVTAFDEHAGLGVVTVEDGTEYPFHCAEIADGTRTIATGASVAFHALPKLGHLEAGGIRPAPRT
jgi:cold shock CspA family protein